MANNADDDYVPESPHSSSSDPATKPSSPIQTTQPLNSPERTQETNISNSSSNKDSDSGPSTTSQTPIMPAIPNLQPASDLNERFTMSGIHDKWQGITTSTSKCDVCRENRRGILYMCRQCSRNVCIGCVQQGDFGDKTTKKHQFANENVVWKGPQSKPKKDKPAKKGTIGGRVTKATKTVSQRVNDTGQGVINHQGYALPNVRPLNSHSEYDHREAFGTGANQSYYPEQARLHQAPQEGYQAPEKHQSYHTNQQATDSSHIAASALASMRSGSSSEHEVSHTGLRIPQMHPARPAVEYHDQEMMPPHPVQHDIEPRPHRPGRFEPYELGRHRIEHGEGYHEEMRSRSRSPFVVRPSALSSNTVHASHTSSPHPQAGMMRPGETSYIRSSREASVSPATIVASPNTQGAGVRGPVARSSEPRFSSSREATPVAPIYTHVEDARGIQGQPRIPSFRHIAEGASPMPRSHPIPRSVPQDYRHGQPPPQPHRDAASMERYCQPTISGPPKSPLTRESFPPARTDGEAFGQWQIFKVHYAYCQHPNTSFDESLLEHTAKLWDHILRQAPNDMEGKFRLMRNATGFALKHLGLEGRNGGSTRWLKDLESVLVERGHAIERSFLDDYRRGEEGR